MWHAQDFLGVVEVASLAGLVHSISVHDEALFIIEGECFFGSGELPSVKHERDDTCTGAPFAMVTVYRDYSVIGLYM